MTVGTDSSQLSNFQLLFLYLTSVIYYFTFNPSRGCATALVWQYVANFSHWVFGFSNICIPFFSYDVELFLCYSDSNKHSGSQSELYTNSRLVVVNTAISRKVVRKNVHATIPKGNMGYDQYTVPDDCRCRTYFCCFPLALANTFPWPFVPILSNFFEKKRTQNHP